MPDYVDALGWFDQPDGEPEPFEPSEFWSSTSGSVRPNEMQPGHLVASYRWCFNTYVDAKSEIADAFALTLSRVAAYREAGQYRLGVAETTASNLEFWLDMFECELIARGFEYRSWRDMLAEHYDRKPSRPNPS